MYRECSITNKLNETPLKRSLESTLSLFNSIDLPKLDSYSLINRFDRKYILPESIVNEILLELSAAYSVLDINGYRLLEYESDYLDTSDLRLYYAHHNGKSTRYKLRVRYYSATDDYYFEIKKKNNKSKTDKQRFRLESNRAKLGIMPNNEYFTDLDITAEQVSQQLKVKYSRICLVNNHHPEKITIDIGLCFVNGKTVPLPGIAIAEIKTDKPNSHSQFADIMKSRRFYPSSVSKYCLGIHLCRPQEKYNAFKPIFQTISKITTEELNFKIK